MEVQITPLVKNYVPPSRATSGSCGWDISAVYKIVIPPYGRSLVPLGFQMSMSNNYYASLHSRSSLLLRGVICLTGLIDGDFSGQPMALLYNISNNMQIIDIGERFIQIVFHKYYHVSFVHVPLGLKVNDSNTERGDRGFGSSDCK